MRRISFIFGGNTVNSTQFRASSATNASPIGVSRKSLELDTVLFVRFAARERLHAPEGYVAMQAGTDLLTLPPDLIPDNHALFLDLDGTLFDIVERPELVTPDEEISALLPALNRRVSGAIAVLTGRCAEDADRILENAVDMIAGLHGQEWLIGGALVRAPAQSGLTAARSILSKLVEQGALDARIEDKGAGLALHYRHAPDQAPLITRAVQQVAQTHGLRALHGKLVSELTQLGATKGSAIITLMHNPPFAGRFPVAIGDDVTDEDAFAAVNELGGYSILVGAPRQTVATYALPDVAAVRAWLRNGLALRPS